MKDRYTDVRDVESTAGTSSLSGARSTSEFIQASDGKDSTALDSTQATSTLEGARSVEQIMEEMKEEESAKKQGSPSSLDKWKKAGVNAKTAASPAASGASVTDRAEDLADTVSDVKNSTFGRTATAVMTGRMPKFSSPIMTAMVSMGASGLGVKAASYDGQDAASGEESVTADPAAVAEAMQKSAPTDSAIAAYQRNVAQAQEQGANVKRLPFTDAQQRQWNAQDQHRMYSNYGTLYEHGQNEMAYNTALLNAAMASVDLPAKTLPKVPSFKQKYLSAVEHDEKQMDINSMSLESLFSGELDLLHVGEQSVTEDMSVINRNAQRADAHAATDHRVDERDAEKQDIAASFAQAAKQGTKDFMDSVFDRGATVGADLAAIGINLQGDADAEHDRSADFF